MSTDVDICNLALARLGDPATISSIDPPEGSAQADHCARFYPMARDAVLTAHPWRFAISRKRLAKLAEAPVGTEANYFALPSDCLRLVSVHDAGEVTPWDENFLDLPPLTYTVEMRASAKVLLCHASDVFVRYVSVRTPESVFPPDVVDAIGWLLASYLAGTMVPGTSGTQLSAQLTQAYQGALRLAIANDSAHTVERVRVDSPFAGDAHGGEHVFD